MSRIDAHRQQRVGCLRLVWVGVSLSLLLQALSAVGSVEAIQHTAQVTQKNAEEDECKDPEQKQKAKKKVSLSWSEHARQPKEHHSQKRQQAKHVCMVCMTSI
jgi:Zn-dependent peptidase ImmA (M78 family)